MSDVRISHHIARAQNNEFMFIRFYDGLQNLIGADYVSLWVKDDRLYFKPQVQKVKGSLKLSNAVSVWKQCDVIRKFEGEYPMEFDTFRAMYYVDLANKSEISYRYGNHNVPHLNYKSHVNEPYVEEEMLKKIIEPEVVDTKYPVYEALIALLMSQIQGKEYKNAIFTSQTIQSMLEREE